MNIIDYVEIGKRIKQRRIEKGFTQEYISEQLDISKEYVSKIECGKVEVNLKRLAELSLVLEVPIEDLISGIVQPSSDYKINEICKTFEDLSPTEREVVYNIIEQIKSLRNK